MQKTDIKIDVEQKSINEAKGLIMDMVRGADSGHTGGPFSSLDFTYVLYKEFLKTLPFREIICGYAEILKHSLIMSKKFFTFLDKNTKNIVALKKPFI